MVNLMIADDEAAIRQGLLSINWRDIGVRVAASVDNGLDAVEILQSEIIDVVLTDIRMPGMNGLELARFIRERNLCAEVILLTGHSDFEYARTGIQYNVLEYILKPSRPEEIIEAVKRACKQVDKRREADMRLKLLEAELGKRQLVMDDEGIVLGEFEYSTINRKIMEYILANYNKPISLSSLSDELHFSSIYLSKVIKRATGYTFLEIVNTLRVYDAASQLRRNQRPLGDICQSVCIGDPRHFSQVFKKHFGMTPSAYKKEPCMPLDTKLAYLIKTMRDSEP